MKAYTRRYANLGHAATQRVEGFNHIIHQVTNGQMSLEQSAKQLAIKTVEIYTRLAEAENMARLRYSTALDRAIFQHLVGNVSQLAIQLVEKEWVDLNAVIASNSDLDNNCDGKSGYNIAYPASTSFYLPTNLSNQFL